MYIYFKYLHFYDTSIIFSLSHNDTLRHCWERVLFDCCFLLIDAELPLLMQMRETMEQVLSHGRATDAFCVSWGLLLPVALLKAGGRGKGRTPRTRPGSLPALTWCWTEGRGEEEVKRKEVVRKKLGRGPGSGRGSRD